MGTAAVVAMLYFSPDPSTPARGDRSKIGVSASAGSTATLGLPSGSAGTVYVARTRAAYDRFNVVSSAGDETGINELMLAGRIFPARTGDRVRVVSGSDPVEVRMLSGSSEGESGLVGRSLLR